MKHKPIDVHKLRVIASSKLSLRTRLKLLFNLEYHILFPTGDGGYAKRTQEEIAEQKKWQNKMTKLTMAEIARKNGR